MVNFLLGILLFAFVVIAYGAASCVVGFAIKFWIEDVLPEIRSERRRRRERNIY